MARIPLVDPASLTRDQRAQYDRFPSNLTRALLLLDNRLAGALPHTANALRASTIDPAWREGAILRVAALQHSDYERFQHFEQARAAGWTPAQIHAIEHSPQNGSLPAEFATVLRLFDAIAKAPTVNDAVFEAAHAALGDRDLTTLVVLVGHYMTVARVVGVLEVPLDAAPDAWSAEH